MTLLYGHTVKLVYQANIKRCILAATFAFNSLFLSSDFSSLFLQFRYYLCFGSWFQTGWTDHCGYGAFVAKFIVVAFIRKYHFIFFAKCTQISGFQSSHKKFIHQNLLLYLKISIKCYFTGLRLFFIY